MPALICIEVKCDWQTGSLHETHLLKPHGKETLHSTHDRQELSLECLVCDSDGAVFRVRWMIYYIVGKFYQDLGCIHELL